MIIVLGVRGEGKTRAAVAAFRERPDGLLVVAAHADRIRVIEDYSFTPSEQRRIKIAQPDILQGFPVDSTIVVDDVDRVLRVLLGGAPTLSTVTGLALRPAR